MKFSEPATDNSHQARWRNSTAKLTLLYCRHSARWFRHELIQIYMYKLLNCDPSSLCSRLLNSTLITVQPPPPPPEYSYKIDSRYVLSSQRHSWKWTLCTHPGKLYWLFMIDSETSKPNDLASGPNAHSHHFHFVVRYNGACCEVSGSLLPKAFTTKA
jgi:hypothetical protein